MRVVAVRSKSLFVALTVSILCWYTVYRSLYPPGLSVTSTFDKPDIGDGGFCPRWHQTVEAYRGCLLDNIHSRNDWVNLVKRCLSKFNHFTSTSEKLLHSGKDDVKKVILPSPTTYKNRHTMSCVVVSLGVSGVESEAELQRVEQPGCRFYAAEPRLANGVAFRREIKGGTLFDVAVADKNANFSAALKGDKWAYDNDDSYQTTVLHGIGLADFLTNYVREPLVDHLWIDVEGSEYKLLPALLKTHWLGAEICQVNVELHNPPTNYGFTTRQFQATLSTLLFDRTYEAPFVPIWTLAYHGHGRLLLFNASSRLCVEKYFVNYCQPEREREEE